ncbi:glycosyltransferase family 117 protein [Thermophagus xiamenensis]|uniref:DUF2723 domain-containing protein n=1 Tax=Thermophagus xiamenensis TaxID=385682 RepID=A0A1I1WUB3_9BACT|nr:DUF2723 domain-containing protein [Thermophagus xiamenensis]SFD98629.1 Protein of unknown function [Thermophagus xiamenensis]
MKLRNSFLKWYISETIVLGISLFVYSYTVAPTVSFWDCGEYIASAYRLQVPHPPGAPFYLLLARLFSLFASDTSQVALSINLLSLVSSAIAVLLLYKILVILLGWLVDEANPRNIFFIEVASIIGSLLFAFTDTFWNSAVESEVYATSFCFSMATLWLFLRWYNSKRNNHRLFFLGVYLMGLSIGVHLLNLLMIPVLVILFIWKFKGHSVINTIQGLVIGSILLVFLYWGLIVNGLLPAQYIERLLVNGLGLPKHSGLIAYVFGIVAILFGGIWLTFRTHPVIHFTFLVSGLIIMGWFSYALVPIRAEANPPINMNAPNNIFSLNEYINRTQYGNRPLLYGPHAGSEIVAWEPDSQFVYQVDKGRYEKVASVLRFRFRSEDMVWFPRIYSRQPQHEEGYQWWTGVNPQKQKPTFTSQISFFLRYQLGHSFLRYLLWNFVGRQNDSQGHGDMLSGNWASGLDWVDKYHLGNRKYPLAEELYSAAANHYYGIPMLMALIGLLYLFGEGRGRKRIVVVLGVIFLITGPAVVWYLNQPPFEPRERDYVYVASIMVIASLGGIGAFAMLKGIYKLFESIFTCSLLGILLFLSGPGLLFSVNLNDHDRSSRYLARDLAVSQLRSCPPNAILFTYGDNDTYPLWYAQHVEEIRTDVRIVNIGLLSLPWYLEQLKRAEIGSAGIHMNLPSEFYWRHQIDYFKISQSELMPVTGVQALEQLKSLNSSSKTKLVVREIPSNWVLSLKDKNILNWKILSSYISAGNLALADIIASNIENRPICFTRNVDRKSLHGIDKFFIGHGLVWLVDNPVVSENSKHALVQYSILMDSVSLARSAETWLDNSCRQALAAAGYRNAILENVNQLLKMGHLKQASCILNKSLKDFPYSPYIDQSLMVDVAKLLTHCGENDEAQKLVRNITYVNLQDIYYFVYSGFEIRDIKARYCKLFIDLRGLAKELRMTELVSRIELEMNSLCNL